MNEKKIPTNPNFKMTTAEAITLIRIMKQRVEKTILEFPEPGMKLEFNVFAQKIGKKFIVSIRRGNIDKYKCTYQGRTYLNNIPLLRLDITNSFHINEDGTKICGNHLHIYNEITEMREAIPFDIENKNLYQYCLEFFKKFHVIQEDYGIQYKE